MNVLDKGEALLEFLSFGYIGNVSEERADREELKTLSEKHFKKAVRFTWISHGICLMALTFLFVLSKSNLNIFIFAGGAHSLNLLIAGIFCPMLEINYIYNEAVPLHVSKSIFDTIYSTYLSGPLLLTIVLILCSIFIPFLKCLDLCLISYRGKFKIIDYLAKACKLLGKWSMADVFVVAILVAYFVPTGIQPKGGGYAESFLKPGFYFFLSYCIISLIINQFSQRKKKAEASNSPL